MIGPVTPENCEQWWGALVMILKPQNLNMNRRTAGADFRVL